MHTRFDRLSFQPRPSRGKNIENSSHTVNTYNVRLNILGTDLSWKILVTFCILKCVVHNVHCDTGLMSLVFRLYTTSKGFSKYLFCVRMYTYTMSFEVIADDIHIKKRREKNNNRKEKNEFKVFFFSSLVYIPNIEWILVVLRFHSRKAAISWVSLYRGEKKRKKSKSCSIRLGFPVVCYIIIVDLIFYLELVCS